MKKKITISPLEIVANLASLFTVPEIQGSCLRIEHLIHSELQSSPRKANSIRGTISHAFTAEGRDVAGRLEDPSEELLVSSIATRRGDFRILSGVWASAGFYLQHFVNIVERMVGEGNSGSTEAIYHLLQVSDEVCRRSGLQRGMKGNSYPVNDLPKEVLNQIPTLAKRVTFSFCDLVDLGVSPELLKPFLRRYADIVGQFQGEIGHSNLERYPLIDHEGKLYVALPTAISVAIRRYILDQLGVDGKERLLEVLKEEYSQLFEGISLLGLPLGQRINFPAHGSRSFAAIHGEIDTGRHLALLFVFDNLEGISQNGFDIPSDGRPEVDREISLLARKIYLDAKLDPAYLGVTLLVVGCGIGRSILFGIPDAEDDTCRTEGILDSDLWTLCHLRDFNSLSLWSTLDMLEAVQRGGVGILNLSGLLNLVEWSRKLGSRLIPDSEKIIAIDSDSKLKIVIDTNSLLDLRLEVERGLDEHSVKYLNGEWRLVRRNPELTLIGEGLGQFYWEATVPGTRRAVVDGLARAWWLEIEMPIDFSPLKVSDYLTMLRIWCSRLCSYLDSRLDELGPGAVRLVVRFERQSTASSFDPSEIQQDRMFGTVVDLNGRTVEISVASSFESAVFNPLVCVEHQLVQVIAAGFIGLAGVDMSSEEVARTIAPALAFRHLHGFSPRNVRDHLRGAYPVDPLKMSELDAASVQLFLCQRAGVGNGEKQISGSKECKQLLNGLVMRLCEELCQELRFFDKLTLLARLLENHEVASMAYDVLFRTSGSILSFADHSLDAKSEIETEARKLKASVHASRLLIGFAISECSPEGGRSPGNLDLSRLMAKVALISRAGGWSDAIHWEAMVPRVYVSAAGEVSVNGDFEEKILTPFGRFIVDRKIKENIEKYFANYSTLEAPERTPDLPIQFVTAFREQMGAPIEAFGRLVAIVRDYALREGLGLLRITRENLVGIYRTEEDGSPVEEIRALIDRLSFPRRTSWLETPPEFLRKDIDPWRSRGRLSVLQKPLISMENSEGAWLVTTPGLLSDSFSFLSSCYYSGELPAYQLCRSMAQWAGSVRDSIGTEFNRSVALSLRGYGWNTESEITLTKLLRQGFDVNYGDIDVLAWSEESSRILIIECKDLQYRRSQGEVAEQLSDFRGKLRPSGKPDYLLKHLNRFELVRQYWSEVSKYCGFSDDRLSVIESHLVLSRIVPVKFALDRMKEKVAVTTFDDLSKI